MVWGSEFRSFVQGALITALGVLTNYIKTLSMVINGRKKKTELVLTYMRDPVVKGLTLLGGEPFQNTWLVDIVRKVKSETGKDIWAYSGYTYEKLIEDPSRRELLQECDVLVDGPFIISQRDLRLRFRGSLNQRIIDVQKTLQTGRVQLMALDDTHGSME